MGIVVLVIGIGMGIGLSNLSKEQNKQIEAMEFTNIDMKKIQDGTFTGVSETPLVKATVEVSVEDHKITDIVITRHDNGKGTAAEAIVLDMIAANTYDVDAVSGATTSSKVIKNAVYNALQEGITE